MLYNVVEMDTLHEKLQPLSSLGVFCFACPECKWGGAFACKHEIKMLMCGPPPHCMWCRAHSTPRLSFRRVLAFASTCSPRICSRSTARRLVAPRSSNSSNLSATLPATVPTRSSLPVISTSTRASTRTATSTYVVRLVLHECRF